MAKILHTLNAILKHAVTTILGLAALGVLGLALSPIGRDEGGVLGVTMLLFLSAWCGFLVWFTHFRQRLSLRPRRVTAVSLSLFLPLWFFGVANMYRPSVYLEHRDWLTYDSEHFVFHYAPDYSHRHEIASYAAVRDTAFEHNCRYLGVTVDDKIDFYVYDELASGSAAGWEKVIFADHDQSIGHEMTHIIAYHIGDKRQKIRLLDEGIATWLNHARIKVPMGHHGVAWSYYMQEYDLAPLTELADTKTFKRLRGPVNYAAASFVGYLLENYGLGAFRQLWIANAEYPELYAFLEDFGLARWFAFIPGRRVHFEATVKDIYGQSLDVMDREWRAWLKQKCGQ